MAEQLIKIRLTASFGGPAGVMPAGCEIETTQKEASSLVSAGYAEYVEEIITTESKSAPVRETTSRRSRKRRK